MITTQDIAKLSKTFATKKDIAKLSETFVTKKYFTKLSKTFVTKAFFLEKFDEIMGELQAIREEQTIGSYRQVRHSDQLENHQSRITKLESLAS